MELSPLVSVIIPTYNRERYVAETINSALNQTYRNFEVIVVDDGSTDDTRGLLKDFGSQIIYIYKINGGVSSARNVGIKKSSGDYIAFLDSDDLWYPEKLEKQINFFKESPGISGVATGFVDFDEKGNLLQYSNQENTLPKDQGELLSDLLSCPPFLTSSLLIKREVIQGVGMFDEDLKTANDLDFIIRTVAEGFRFGIIPEPLVRYRKHREGISKNTRAHENRLKVIDKFLREHPYYRRDNKKSFRGALARVFLNYGKTLLHEGYCTEAINKLLLSFYYRGSLEALKLIFKGLVKGALPEIFLKHYKNSKNRA